jgi:surface polysaccharide O-acyltransferase-like enzyme
MNSKQPSRIQSVDAVRVIAIFAVIIIHTSPFTNTYIWLGRDLNVGYLLDQLARFAVPFFFVISGFFWASKIKSGSQIADSTKKMAKKIATIFLAWSIIYLLPTNLSDSFQYGGLGPFEIIYWNITKLIDHPMRSAMEGAKVHLWFLVALLFCLVICAIFLTRAMKKSLIVLSIVLYSIGLLGKAYADSPIGFHSEFNFRNGPFFGLVFFVTGYVLSESKERKSWLIIGLVLTVFGTLMHFTELFVLRSMWGTTMIQDYVIGTYFMGVGVAMIALSNPTFLGTNQFSKIGPLVLGIYAVHFVFVDLLRPFDAGLKGVTAWGFGYPFGVFVLSLASTYALSRFTITKSIVV